MSCSTAVTEHREEPAYTPAAADIAAAARRLSPVLRTTPLEYSEYLSQRSGANIYLKREDRQVVRSFKVRGAFNKIAQLDDRQRAGSVVCSSAGNHAQGVAFACSRLEVRGVVYMPASTPQQKIEQVRRHGQQWIDIRLVGQTYDDCYQAAIDYCRRIDACFVHPFDDPSVIEGQATVGSEILAQADFPIDHLFLPVGGGGLAAGVASVFEQYSAATRIVGVEAAGAAAMAGAIAAGCNTALENIDTFADGAAVKKVGDRTFELCRRLLAQIVTVPESALCATIVELYNQEAIVAEPAGVLSISALALQLDEIAGQNVVCVLSGGNNDIRRLEEISRRAALPGLHHPP